MPEALRYTYFRLNSLRASRRYDPKPYPGRMVIFEASGFFRDPHLGWDGLVTGGIEVCNVSFRGGSAERYHTVFIPALAEPLQEALRAARSRQDDLTKSASR